MNAPDWLAAYAERLGVPAPTKDELTAVLDLAGEAAHSSERIAAPVACWLAAQGRVVDARSEAMTAGAVRCRPTRPTASPMAEREYDVVVFGATGFTGALTAEYLAAHAPPSTRWAIAGRSREKLEALRAASSPSAEATFRCSITADVGDPASLRAMAESTRVVITTVGPYIHYGEPVVAACAAAGTDYVDLTGEPEFVDLMWLRHHDQARRTGAKLVHSCGFDSIPYDLGALYTVNALPEGVPIKLEGFVRVGGTVSGGTLHSAVHVMARLRQGRQVAAQRRKRARAARARPAAPRPHGVTAAPRTATSTAGGWALPAPTIDPITVLRSARALDRYGPDFSYGHYIVAKHLPVAAGLAAGVGTVVALVRCCRPAREGAAS